jgi:hypothetical protein
MMYFPQLFSGATAQFPIKRQRTARTVMNQSPEGYQVKMGDAGAAITEWHLSFDQLSDEELAALEALFAAAEGSLTPFTFVDPADNLLAWSEQQSQPAWQADPLLTLTTGLADPVGGANAYRVCNPSAGTLALQQTINAPASLAYCLSLYGRSDPSTQVYLIRGSESDLRTVGPQWTRISSAGQLQSSAETISFGIALAPGGTVDIFGVQVEAQTSASLYKVTAEIGGVYANARFRNDTLTITTVSPGCHSCELDIVNVEHIWSQGVERYRYATSAL